MALITRVEARIAEMKVNLKAYTDLRNPTRRRISGARTSSV
jgi:hypothetical protein